MMGSALAGFLAVAILVVVTTAGTIWLVKVRPAMERDPDTQFWYCFAGMSILLPAILGTAVVNRWAGAAMVAIAAATWWHVNKMVCRRLMQAKELSASVSADAVLAELSNRHNAVLMRWSHYELDPAAAIDFPSMSDVHVPETSALTKAYAVASKMRQDTADGEFHDYEAAVTSLEISFVIAEDAAHASAETFASEMLANHHDGAVRLV
ncbi:hypothetical protein [Arthrobacter cryoconiti]|uniref:Uncharacterized protein n=1 Tax=Arthrobacter cryoconiti TaxID=748907 RepID=A0ABV8QVG0_9MICC|nr:hypothetical protein [Arthrobacter cryoconiti]MCC9069646.1 hypothetical protein [Arthrobacter cryoconiti]